MICSRKHIKYLCHYAEENGFSLPPGFKDKSVKFLQKHYNGIGAEWMPRRVRNFSTKLWRHMEPHALLHDIEYLSVNKSFWNFTKANLRLFYNGVRSRHFFSGLALATVCQFFGWSAWKEGKEIMAYCYYLEESK